MRKITLLLCLIFARQLALNAQTTFCEHIAPIIYTKCASCHRDGGIGPMPLTNYQQVSAEGEMLLKVIDSGLMPPWMPDTKYSHFLNERILSQQQIELIRDWIKTGKTKGDAAAEPDLPMFPTVSTLGKPDLSLSMKQSYLHKGNNTDEYRVFVLPTGLKEGHNIKAIEICPGNAAVVHHIILGLDTTRFADKLDAKDPALGYAQYAGFGFYPTYDNWSGWVPGNKTRVFPANICNYILPNSEVLLQMHYAPSPVDVTDSTTVNIYYADEPTDRYIRSQLIGPNELTDGPFFIPANKVKTFHAKYKIVDDYSLISVTPHAHWLCKNWQVFSISPKGDTTHLIKIDKWDFNWQNFFALPKLVHLEKGSTIYASATFDNTTGNYANPNNPPKNVMWGESAKDEMFLFYFAYTGYKKGDENITVGGIDDTFEVSKNIDNTFAFNYTLAENSSVNLQLFNAAGKPEKQLITNQTVSFGKHSFTLPAGTLKPGTYWCKLTTSYFSASKKIVVQ